MNWITISVILVLVTAVRSSTESTCPLYHVLLTSSSNITLDPFPYDVSGIHVTVQTSAEIGCWWTINNGFNSTFTYNATNLLLWPFGVNYTNNSVVCHVLETGIRYRLFIGNTCPCKKY